MRKASRLLFVGLSIALTVAGVIVYALVLPTTLYHFHELTLNAYTDGTADFTVDATRMTRTLSVLALLTMIFGLLVGAAIGLTSLNFSRTARNVGKVTVEESMELLLKSGFVRGVGAEEGTKYEITDTGLRFLGDYQDLKSAPQPEPAHHI